MEQPKFKFGDRLWFMRSNIPVCEPVTQIALAGTTYMYGFGGTGNWPEHQLFTTKVQLCVNIFRLGVAAGQSEAIDTCDIDEEVEVRAKDGTTIPLSKILAWAGCVQTPTPYRPEEDDD